MAVETAVAEEQQQIIRSSLRSMLQKYEPRRAELREMVDKQGIFPEELWQDYAKVGLMGCLVPEEYGGNGAGLLALTYSFEEIVSQGFFPGLLLVTSMDAACIVKNASEEIKRDFLPKICDGSRKLCFALT